MSSMNDGRIPIANGYLSETEDKKNKVAHEKENTTGVHTLDLAVPRRLSATASALSMRNHARTKKGAMVIAMREDYHLQDARRKTPPKQEP
ncbi:hypothetical protein C343_04919 [Cryptococcus neoformans C23]|uniref:Uncharacterized protein n=1 Tax=Cryptococcus neoformans (strain H99 / ATCC 208821 / CBS 10515 / FGSC 9487) TaxID=235443 RepID=J9VQN9_CRYN9|nr:hypothetical protein CNAG_03569 [Cryptococcus neoformans var. grubii H99]AUB26751.1 hypothetical protein CKF44_03569 [Cryptococcus neoformans var. grubii]OWZ29883.1 hypothetical protein C347_04965 [Cryptococcus neoformans var. grubii AD2-60a]OWZ41757.1 hypothetical protein C343_04919 [Cryptococcus neoformans var. grubii C23]OXC83147.1 hypothetical protein C344_04644 [Cryptococcus neoformans var. grubii AD1-7a]OXG36079.1 hypothetical protein C360_02681 [Cryptococcus neoformans var. grubii Bt|eukprot:XP_012051340.1 hypothetical protein CNAG_03569 [Cryptococcus neoformans var. grubii H99]